MAEQKLDSSAILICGGTSSEMDADETVQALVDELAPSIAQHSGKEYPYLKAISFKSQMVSGTNYFVKIDAGSECIHARIYQKLPCYGGTIELHSIQSAKERHDPIEYF